MIIKYFSRPFGLLLNQSTNSLFRLRGNNSLNVICCYESSYQSSISLKNLYPSSSLQLSTPTKIPENSVGKFNGYIPIDALKITYSRSSGPGGQNVNTVSTKVDLRFHVETADWISQETRAKIADMHKTKISKEGFLIVRSDKTRSQQLNLADCMEALRTLIRQAEFKPPALSKETEEQLRRRREKANHIRLIEKRSRSMTKVNRQSPTL